ncbi:MAG: DUF1189 family protein [Anaeroplasmataceae bacterium]
MLSRISTSLFRPKQIGKYIIDKPLLVTLYFLLISLIAFVPSIITLSTVDNVTYTDQVELVNNIRYSNKDLTGISIKGNKLINEDSRKHVFEGNGIYLTFNTVEFEQFKYTVSFVLEEDKISVYSAGKKIKSTGYDEIKFNDFNFADVQEVKYNSIDSLITIIDASYVNAFYSLLGMNILDQFFKTVVLNLLIVLLLFLFTSSANPAVPSVYRFKVCIYGITIALLFQLLATVSGVSLFQFFGFIMAFFYVRKSLKSIVKININK